MPDDPEDRFHVRLAKVPQPDGRGIVVMVPAGNLDWFEAGRLVDAIQEARRQYKLREMKGAKRAVKP